MHSEIFLENINCLGCKNTVIKEAKKQDLVETVDVEMDSGKVSIEYNGGKDTLSRVKSRLYRIGYPEKESHHHKKSFTTDNNSCPLIDSGAPQKYRAKQYDIAED